MGNFHHLLRVYTFKWYKISDFKGIEIKIGTQEYLISLHFVQSRRYNGYINAVIAEA